MPINPLGPLPGPSSQQGELNALDFKKVFRLLLVQGIGLFVTLAVPFLTKQGVSYNWHGHDYTAEVLIVVNACAELARRFLTSAPKV